MSDKFFGSKIDLSSLIEAIGVKSEEYADVIRVKTELYSLKKKRDESFLLLGKSVYKMMHNGAITKDKISEKCIRISELDELIDQKEHELENIHETASRRLKKKSHKKNRHKHTQKSAELIIKPEEYEIEPYTNK